MAEAPRRTAFGGGAGEAEMCAIIDMHWHVVEVGSLPAPAASSPEEAARRITVGPLMDDQRSHNLVKRPDLPPRDQTSQKINMVAAIRIHLSLRSIKDLSKQ